MRAYRILQACLGANDLINIDFQVLQPEDIDRIRLWRNDQKSILRQNKNISECDQINYFEKEVFSQYDVDQPLQILFSIFERGIHIGYGGLVHISWENKRAEISFLFETKIMSNEIYKAYLIQFLNFLSKVAFNHLNFVKLTTETFFYRAEIINLLENYGFVREGILSRHTVKDGVLIDSYLHALFNKDS